MKKDNFRMNPGITKMSSVHSFKGWEIDTLFLFLTPKDDEEMIYTAITRAKRKLYIFNLGCRLAGIDSFMKKNCDDYETYYPQSNVKPLLTSFLFQFSAGIEIGSDYIEDHSQINS